MSQIKHQIRMQKGQTTSKETPRKTKGTFEESWKPMQS